MHKDVQKWVFHIHKKCIKKFLGYRKSYIGRERMLYYGTKSMGDMGCRRKGVKDIKGGSGNLREGG